MPIPYQLGDNRPALYVCRVLGGSQGAFSPNSYVLCGCVDGILSRGLRRWWRGSLL